MKTIGLGVILGVLMASLMIYWLHPLNTGAVGLITTVSVGLGSAIVALFTKKRSEKDEDEADR